MSTYKIGNKVTGVIRAYSSGSIGSVTVKYDNEPYTIINGSSVELKFRDKEVSSTSIFKQSYYNDSVLEKVNISNVKLTDRIFNLIFAPTEEKMFTKVDTYQSDDKKLYINAPTATIYQVFIYNADQKLVRAFGTLDNLVVDVDEDGEYFVCYQYEGAKSYSLDRPENQYFTLDLIVIGNEEDVSQCMNVHIAKCGLKIDKDMYFNNNSNAVDLTFTVLDTAENYIVLQ